jgi:CheY-like chemotaxis protein
MSRNEGFKEKVVKDKSSLFDLLIHDLTGPLSVVSTSAANLLQRKERYGALTDDQRRIMERIIRNIHKAQTLLQEMVEISRSEEGLFQKEYFPVDVTLKESILDVLEISAPHAAETLSGVENQEEFQRVLEANGIFIAITGNYSKAPFCHDQKKIQQIFRNLISNAMKYRRSRIDVSINGDTDLYVSVEDDGIGIPPEHQESIFKRFVRVQDKRYANVPGFGLGLTGVKALVEAMSGEIKLASREGIGSKFTVRIPPFQLPMENRVKAESILNGKRILAVDDEPDVLTILEEEIIQACPACKFDKATTFEAADRMLKRETYDLVILDIMGVQGFDLLKVAVSRDFKVAMLTAHALSPEALKRSFELMARTYLPKEKIGEIVPFLEDVLTHEYLSGWKRLFEKLKAFFDSKFESDWEKKSALNWQEWGKA